MPSINLALYVSEEDYQNFVENKDKIKTQTREFFKKYLELLRKND